MRLVPAPKVAVVEEDKVVAEEDTVATEEVEVAAGAAAVVVTNHRYTTDRFD